jgi:LytS/YehU family sensor histidine kinase
MAELELQSLRAQLNPHFMFNSLNAIQELILMEENDKSHTYLARFAKLLRMLLENANSPFIPLARELEFLQLYLSLEKLRIPELSFNIDVDPQINKEEIKIPNMILQPYIENAIWHGLSHKPGEKNLRIHVAQQNGTTLYEIEDNGVGRQKSAELKSQYRKEHKSKGMELLTKRFKLLQKEYGSEINTTISDVITHNQIAGTKVSILVPTFHHKETATP